MLKIPTSRLKWFYLSPIMTIATYARKSPWKAQSQHVQNFLCDHAPKSVLEFHLQTPKPLAVFLGYSEYTQLDLYHKPNQIIGRLNPISLISQAPPDKSKYNFTSFPFPTCLHLHRDHREKEAQNLRSFAVHMYKKTTKDTKNTKLYCPTI